MRNDRDHWNKELFVGMNNPPVLEVRCSLPRELGGMQ